MLLLYYNQTNRNYYLKYYKRAMNGYMVGYTNQYGHTVVKILIIHDKGLVDVSNVDEYLVNKYLSRKPRLKTRLINGIIRLLNKLDD